VTVLALGLGSRGDVQPMAALVAALVREGVDARVFVCADLEPVAQSIGAPTLAIPVRAEDATELVRSTGGSRLFRTRLGQAHLLRRWVADIAPAVAGTVLAATQPGDTLLTGILTRDLATALGQGRGCRVATMLFTGQVPTAHRDSHFAQEFFTPFAAYNRWGSRLSWRVATGLGASAGRIARDRLGIPPGIACERLAAADRNPIILAASPLLVPRAPDWPTNLHQTGALVAEESADLPQTVRDFLAVGPRPVFVGFGSMGPILGDEAAELARAAARLAGLRVIVPSPRNVTRAEGDALEVGSVPHTALFRQLAGIVHHGGAGTTWAGLSSGIPSAAVPFGVDQPYHAARLHRLGVGPPPIPIQRLTPLGLALMLTQLTSGTYAARAAEVGRLARAERGIPATIETLARLHLI